MPGRAGPCPHACPAVRSKAVRLNSRRSRRTGHSLRWIESSNCPDRAPIHVHNVYKRRRTSARRDRPTSPASRSVAKSHSLPRLAPRAKPKHNIVTCRSARLHARISAGAVWHAPCDPIRPSSRMSGVSPMSLSRNASPAPPRPRSSTPGQAASPKLLPTSAGSDDPSRRPSIQFKAHANRPHPRGSPRRGQPRRRISSPPPPP